MTLGQGGQLPVVGHGDDGLALFLGQPPEDVEFDLAVSGVQVAGRLIRQEWRNACRASVRTRPAADFW
ncbi:MAG TPA: hypothetical protein VMV64_02640 [Sulfuricella sp.]|nr:hypothetical protein [Sulfuricella sp.]